MAPSVSMISNILRGFIYLRRGQHPICHDHRHTNHTNKFEHELGCGRVLDEPSETSSDWLHLVCVVSLQLLQLGGTGITDNMGEPGKERVKCKSTSLAVIVGSEDNETVLDGDDESERPDNDGECADEIVPARLAGKCG